MGFYLRLPGWHQVRSSGLMIVLLLTILLPQGARAGHEEIPDLSSLRITAFDCSGYIEAYVPYNEGGGFIFNVNIPGAEGWYAVQSMHFTGPGIYSTTFDLPSDQDSWTGMVQISYDHGKVHTASMTITGCAEGPADPDDGLVLPPPPGSPDEVAAYIDQVMQVVDILIAELLAILDDL